jgi:hypothetical protein
MGSLAVIPFHIVINVMSLDKVMNTSDGVDETALHCYRVLICEAKHFELFLRHAEIFYDNILSLCMP